MQAYNEMGKTKWTPVIEDEIAHPLFLVLKEIIIIIIIIPEIIFDTEYIAFSVYFPIISVSSVIKNVLFNLNQIC